MYVLAAKRYSCTQGKFNDHSMTEECTWAPTVPCNEALKSSTMNDGVDPYNTRGQHNTSFVTVASWSIEVLC